MFRENVQHGTQIILITSFAIRKNEREVAKQAWGKYGDTVAWTCLLEKF